MKRINRTSIKKTIYYLRRNGIRKTCAAVRERLDRKRTEEYEWVPPTAEKLLMQSRQAEEHGYTVTFSIVVPAYRTPGNCLRELMEALLAQSYGKWELVLADASGDNSVRNIAAEYTDTRIRYISLGQNAGIAENTNQALAHVTGDYVGLLDHDDVLTADALYEMAKRIEEGRRAGREPWMLYSDEDKCNGDMTAFFEPNRKEDFNLAFSKPVPAQEKSVVYLNQVAHHIRGPLYVGGHSKGGNLAIYASMYCNPRIQNKITGIYSMDGPGFRPETLQQGNYEAIQDRVTKILPHSSLVGMLFEKRTDFEIVESSVTGLMQHYPLTWVVASLGFIFYYGHVKRKMPKEEKEQ